MADNTINEKYDFGLRPASIDDKPLLFNLLQLCLHELSDFGEGLDIDDDGRFSYPYFDLYWEEEQRHPYLLLVDNKVAGFTFIRSDGPNTVAEFFVLRKFRRAGLGSWAARALFSEFPGDWEVHELPDNDDATAFWCRAIPYQYQEETNSDGVVQRFTV